ncbi:MAG: acyl-CoA dehydrogenase [Reyranella sp.]|uniref:acyl-CoA dehydrogenase family protein n=1 Tax=Reyranella sp. TaxID=1929291 RepID=UPI0012148AD9|nr:acyl-CoA dehydrogenase family protein [Reyranella sp.]TAJ86845.1 MAG: acyl-CoA dehydrogenase [Reyranella sp.]
MSPWLAAARAVGAEIAARHADDVDLRARFPAEAVTGLRDRQLLGLLVPSTEGGAGAGIADVVSICHELGRYCASTAMVYAMHQIQVACIVRHAGHNPWQRAFLRRLADGQLLLASATSEAGAAGDVRSSICALDEKRGRFTLVKQAPVISYGEESDAILVTARRTAQSPPSDQVIVVVPRSGVELQPQETWNTLGMRGTCSRGYRLTAEGEMSQVIPVPYADVSAQTMLPVSHLVWGALWLGIATDALGRARAFVRAEAKKRPGETPLGAARLAVAVNELQTMKSNLLACLRLYEAAIGSVDGPSAISLAVAMNNLKLGSSQSVVKIVGEAMLICGLAGYRNDSPFSLGRHLRDAHSAAVMVSNDRISANNATLALALRDDLEPLA